MCVFAIVNSKNDVISITKVSVDYKFEYGSKDVSNADNGLLSKTAQVNEICCFISVNYKVVCLSCN